MAKQTFEGAMAKLEQIVEELESGELPLEKTVKKFEEGIRLSSYCSQVLDETEKRISILLTDAEGKSTERPFEQASDTASGVDVEQE